MRNQRGNSGTVIAFANKVDEQNDHGTVPERCFTGKNDLNKWKKSLITLGGLGVGRQA